MPSRKVVSGSLGAVLVCIVLIIAANTYSKNENVQPTTASTTAGTTEATTELHQTTDTDNATTSGSDQEIINIGPEDPVILVDEPQPKPEIQVDPPQPKPEIQVDPPQPKPEIQVDPPQPKPEIQVDPPQPKPEIQVDPPQPKPEIQVDPPQPKPEIQVDPPEVVYLKPNPTVEDPLKPEVDKNEMNGTKQSNEYTLAPVEKGFMEKQAKQMTGPESVATANQNPRIQEKGAGWNKLKMLMRNETNSESII